MPSAADALSTAGRNGHPSASPRRVDEGQRARRYIEAAGGARPPTRSGGANPFDVTNLLRDGLSSCLHLFIHEAPSERSCRLADYLAANAELRAFPDLIRSFRARSGSELSSEFFLLALIAPSSSGSRAWASRHLLSTMLSDAARYIESHEDASSWVYCSGGISQPASDSLFLTHLLLAAAVFHAQSLREPAFVMFNSPVERKIEWRFAR